MNGGCYHAAFLIWGNPQCFGARLLPKGNLCACRIGARTESRRSRCGNSGMRSIAYSNPIAPKTQQHSAPWGGGGGGGGEGKGASAPRRVLRSPPPAALPPPAHRFPFGSSLAPKHCGFPQM